ncbi:MAG: alpha-galactosidase [Ktedonobacteraceae bacterium]|nr:alpha-galactosidase [Ktedonobacteraceae bacterium]
MNESMKGRQGMLLKKRLTLLFIFLTVVSLMGVSNLHTPTHIAHASPALPAENNGIAKTPFMGWSTWSYIGKNPTAANIEAQAKIQAASLKAYGYNYVLMDDWYYLNPTTTVDADGYWYIDASKFPNGIAAVASYVHSLGLKFGSYVTPGIPVEAVKQNITIKGTSYKASQIADTSKYEINYNYGNKAMYAINYSAPGAQAYINGWADQLASWGIDFLKIDGVGDSDIPDIQAWSTALKQSGRSIYFDLSNTLDIANANTWKTNAHAWRTQGDVECYNSCRGQLVNWATVSSRFNSAASWAQYGGYGGFNDLDAMDVADGTLDGLTNTQRQTTMSLWAMASAPMYLGDDLSRMDSYGLSLLTNTEVVALDQGGIPALRVGNANNLQVWEKPNGDGSYSVGLFNLGTATASIKVNWSQLGFGGSAAVRNLWTHTNLGSFNGSYTATSVPAYGSVLLRVTPSVTTTTTTSYEAEAAALAGGAKVATCSNCSGGKDVGYIGKGGTLQFNNVNVSKAGSYVLNVSFVDGDAGRITNISVNGGAATPLIFTGTADVNWNKVQVLKIIVSLNAGNNTLLFSNASAYGPDIDRITVG